MKTLKDKAKHIRDKMKDENGLVIVEAAIVFPVMFFVLFFIIYMGNLYYQQAQIDHIVQKYALKGAAYVADPALYNIDNGQPIEIDARGLDIEPYRYILGGFTDNGTVADIENRLSRQVKEEIGSSTTSFFSNMDPKVVGSDNDKIATFNSYIVYSTFVVQVNYEVKFPIRFMGEGEPTIAKFSSRAEVAVNDAPEFIRNVDMVVDLLDGTETGDTITGIFEKINGFIEKFASK